MPCLYAPVVDRWVLYKRNRNRTQGHLDQPETSDQEDFKTFIHAPLRGPCHNGLCSSFSLATALFLELAKRLQAVTAFRWKHRPVLACASTADRSPDAEAPTCRITSLASSRTMSLFPSSASGDTRRHQVMSRPAARTETRPVPLSCQLPRPLRATFSTQRRLPGAVVTSDGTTYLPERMRDLLPTKVATAGANVLTSGWTGSSQT